MSKDLKIIKRLRKKYGISLEKVDTENIWKSQTYVVDENNNVIGLNLIGLKLSDISVIEDLKSLTMLYLQHNKLSNISVIEKLKKLTNLDMSSNQLSDISNIKELKNLTKLYLSHNKISDISVLRELKNLKRFVLTHNKIYQLPKDIVELGMKIKWEYEPYGNGIFLEGNPLETPPVEIVRQGTEAVWNYFKEMEQASVRLLESKLLIVGNGEVGKTTLMRKLKDNNFQVELGKEPTTHGINIVPWELRCSFDAEDSENVKLHFWDFGGQAIYHATHQFFLTKRSIYLLVWEARKEEETQGFDYWFNIIKLLSDNSPVIVVMNKSDVRIKYLDEAAFIEKFKNIVTFLKVSCLTGDGISELTEKIREVLRGVPHLHDQLPGVWLDIRERLTKEEKDYISLEGYFEICREYGMDEERAEFLSGYLHDLGVILHYRHDRLLENTVILNPEWATEAVYKLIDTRHIQENKGRFTFEDLKDIWDLTRYPREKHQQLIRLMEKFELCFNFTGTDIYIIPELLPADRPPIPFDEYKAAGNLHFRYSYDFMPEGIISRFISRVYYLIKDDHFWKNGVELRFEDSTALVVSDRLNREIKISVIGSCKRELLGIIRNELEHIHETLNMHKNKQYDEMIPCRCGPCLEPRRPGTPYAYKYEMLKMFQERGNPIFCPVSGDEVPVETLLRGVEKKKRRKDILKSMVKTAHYLQGLSKSLKNEEDSRSDFMALFLSTEGFIVKEQPRWGRSATGKSIGRPDMKIIYSEEETEAMVEAFNLHCFDRAKIDGHLKKLFGYDPAGLEQNFIIVYSETRKFLQLWKRYSEHLDHIRETDFDYPLTGEIKELETGYTDIKAAHAVHLREGSPTDVFHIFINMK
ncbi:MAG: leucine-rich repeat domain-containing protein [Candidatus Aminicenantes bacterium]|nr:MAG: leucine-rich repeat domain-containing protein [Candidatus Aminicenantes bacterium]